ncbi:response regulator transcription factor [Methylophaga nitratireducenticrescens]|uniref:Copper-sensing two-component system response regulator CpxR n=1 Tax=Methylophaga nitratireducenticrescens TaxID=754476 RepID=I1XII3_METNJ|nr:response regulator transcription factor [Methylophaga nitratireducenticrescens]AFI84202.1 DNA-binding response regulator [Methylophaga nitratireducenticrescens]AUZ84283.1 DNA-binding response regulator [Methylophaga nitratireducenticrescens]
MPDKNKDPNSILIIEDDLVLNHQLKQLLENQSFVVCQCFNGEQGLLTAVSNHFDLILLDISLPQRDGYSVLNTLRKTRQTPVIILTAHGAEEERILGFKNGADDYLPKPFNFTELVLRIEVILRRASGPNHQQPDISVLQHEGLMLDRLKQQVFFHGHAVQLTPIQFKLLWILMQHANHLLSKAQLYRLVMERDFSRYDRSLDMHMSRVRRKLVEVGMPVDRLQTVHGTGYILL